MNLQSKKTEIISNVIKWQQKEYPNRTNNYAKCERDLEYVLTAYINDLEFNTTRNTEYVASKYWFNNERQIKEYETEIAVHNYMVKYIINHTIFDINKKDHLLTLKDILTNIITVGPDFMNYMHMHKYRYVMEYDTDAIIDPFIIEQSLREAWATTPSKQNMMPYNIFVLGPKDKKIKELIYYKSIQREYKTNFARYDVDENDHIAVEREFFKNREAPQYINLKTAPYVLICTQRIVTKMNEWNQYLSDNHGMNFEQIDPVNKKRAIGLSILEIGMFTQTFSNLCLMHGIDISHTRCLPMEMEFWQEPEFNFLTEVPQLVMTAGVGKKFRREFYPPATHAIDYKPDFDQVVKFI
jgi:hypothetical protein